MTTPQNNVKAFFLRLVSPVIFKNRIVATILHAIYYYMTEYNNKIDNIVNTDI